MNVSHETSLGNSPNCIYNIGRFIIMFHMKHCLVCLKCIGVIAQKMFHVKHFSSWYKTFRILFICMEMFNVRPTAFIKIAMSLLFCDDVSHETFPSLNI